MKKIRNRLLVDTPETSKFEIKFEISHLIKTRNFLIFLDESSEKKSKKTTGNSSTSQTHKNSENEIKKSEETSIKTEKEKEKEEDSDKIPEKSEKKEKTVSQSGPVLTSNEKSRRKQVEIEMKKWEKEQVVKISFLTFLCISFNKIDKNSHFFYYFRHFF